MGLTEELVENCTASLHFPGLAPASKVSPPEFRVSGKKFSLFSTCFPALFPPLSSSFPRARPDLETQRVVGWVNPQPWWVGWGPVVTTIDSLGTCVFCVSVGWVGGFLRVAGWAGWGWWLPLGGGVHHGSVWSVSDLQATHCELIEALNIIRDANKITPCTKQGNSSVSKSRRKILA